MRVVRAVDEVDEVGESGRREPQRMIRRIYRKERELARLMYRNGGKGARTRRGEIGVLF